MRKTIKKENKTKRVINIILKIILCLLIFTPILGAIDLFPKPTAEMYNTQEAFNFIDALYNTNYIIYLMAIVFATSIILIILNKTAVSAIILFPITINIFLFHLFLDGGIFSGGAIMGELLFLINIYFIWENKDKYLKVWDSKKS